MADISGYIDIIRNATSGESVRDAIIRCMNDINQDAAIQITTKSISGKLSKISSKYKAPTGYAWSEINLDITPDDSDTSTQPQIVEDEFIVNNDTQNGEYKPDSGHTIGTVKVDLSLIQPSDIVDNITITIDDLDELNGYSAINYGYTAMKRVTFAGENIAAATGGTIGPGGVLNYPVTFIDSDGTFIQTVSVPKGGTATCSKQPSSKDGIPFSGWNPTPTNVTKPLTCVAQYTEPTLSVEEITDTWEQICANKGADYPIGAFKSLIIDQYFSYDDDRTIFPSIDEKYEGTYKFSLSCYMTKVASGEGSTTSTWLSCIPLITHDPVGSDPGADGKLVPMHIPKIPDSQYTESNMTKWLNSIFLYHLPSPIQKNVKTVVKNYKNRLSTNEYTNRPIQTTIWLPSVKELAVDSLLTNTTYIPTDLVETYVENAITNGSARYMQNLGYTDPDEIYYFFAKMWAKSKTDFSGHPNNASVSIFTRDSNSQYTARYEYGIIAYTNPSVAFRINTYFYKPFSSELISDANVFGFCL